jgi:hypothetical protein
MPLPRAQFGFAAHASAAVGFSAASLVAGSAKAAQSVRAASVFPPEF